MSRPLLFRLEKIEVSLGCTFGGAGDESSQRLYRCSLWIHKNERQCPRPVRRGPRRFGAPPPPAIPTSVTPTSGPVYVNRTGRRGGRGYTRSSKALRWCPAPTDHGPWGWVWSLGSPSGAPAGSRPRARHRPARRPLHKPVGAGNLGLTARGQGSDSSQCRTGQS